MEGGGDCSSVWRRLRGKLCQELSSCEVSTGVFRELEKRHMLHFLSENQCNTYCPPPPKHHFLLKIVQPQGLPFNRHLAHPSFHPWLSFYLCCVENSKAWSLYNRGLLTGLAGYSHCFRKDTKCPPLGVGWWGVRCTLYNERAECHQNTAALLRTSETSLHHEFPDGPYQTFTHLLPHSINVYSISREVIEVRLKHLTAFPLMYSLVGIFWRK